MEQLQHPNTQNLIVGPLRGSRTYLYPADIVDGLIRICSSQTNISLEMVQRPDCGLKVVLAGGIDQSRDDIVGRFQCKIDGKPERFLLLADRTVALADPIPDNYSALVAGARLEELSISATRLDQFSFIDQTLALSLALAINIFPGQLFRLSTWQLKSTSPKCTHVSIAEKRKMGKTFWRAQILADENLIGHLLLAPYSP